MSSTNRGSKRVENDFYETPSWCVEAILPHLPLGGVVLDPCAGKGAILRAAGKAFHQFNGYEINPLFEAIGFEDEDTLYWVCLDSLGEHIWQRADVVLMNPPFSKKVEFVERSIKEQSPRHGTTCALLPISFLGSQKRREFVIANPCDVYVMSDRPSFGLNKAGKKGTDSCYYAWFVWGPGRGGRWSIL